MYDNLPYLLVCFLMGLGLSTVDAPEQTSEKKLQSGPVVCEVKVETEGATNVITALASATDVKSGLFTFELEKTGVNTARTRQRGEFALAAGETKELAVARLKMSDSEKLSGKLSLDWEDGKTDCDVGK